MPIGDVYGRLTIIGDGRVPSLPVVRCECGVEKTARMSDLKAGHTVSCGCKARSWLHGGIQTRNKKHGMANSSEYRIWSKMKRRCANPKELSYRHYGGRGIEVCERWKISFENFLEDMGLRPSIRHSIERKEVDGNYEPDNCIWADAKTQTRNKRTTRWVEWKGERVKMADICERLGVSLPLVYLRTVTLGWSIEDAVSIAANGTITRHEYQGEMLTTGEISDRVGINASVVSGRIARGLPMEKVVEPVREPLTISFNGETLSPDAWGNRIGISGTAIRTRIARGWPIEKALTRHKPANR